MHDHFSELYEWDEHGHIRRKKKPVAGDRDRISFPMTAMDHAVRAFSPVFADGSMDHTNPHARGLRFADTNDPARLEQAYAERSRRLEDGGRRKDAQRDASHPRMLDLDAARQQADAAYHARSQRLSNQWRNRNSG